MSENPSFPLTDANGYYTYGDGSNLRNGSNPTYAVSDFVGFYPQFGPDNTGMYVVPENVIQAFIDMATASLDQARWRSTWQVAMGWYVAHFCTLFLQSAADPNSGATAVFEAGRAKGVITSKSVGDVSVSIDQNITGIDTWAAWKLTTFGQQLATMGRLYGKGGMLIY